MKQIKQFFGSLESEFNLNTEYIKPLTLRRKKSSSNLLIIFVTSSFKIPKSKHFT